jgi:type IV secretion system protein VirB6
MNGACPAFSADSPLVRGLLDVTDCNLQILIQGGYASLLQPESAFGGVLTAALTIYVALIGYRLLLGRSPLSIGEFALSAVKLAAVVALATQWGNYQKLVYDVLFYGPEQLANLMSRPLWHGSWAGDDVFEGLQRAFTDLTAFSPATPPGTPSTLAPASAATGVGALTAAGAGQLSTLLSRAGFDSLLLLGSAVLLLLSTLGVLVACKIVLGLLLALGPLFIALMLFDTTRGLFEGWLRAALAFAFAPLAVTVLLALGLTLLQPSLEQIEAMRASGRYVPGVAFAVTVLAVAICSVTVGMIGAAGMISAGFRLPRARRQDPVRPDGEAGARRANTSEVQTRSGRIASAVLSQARRENAVAAIWTGGDLRPSRPMDRPMTFTSSLDRAPAPTLETRLGQQPRREAAPREGRQGPRASDARRT